MSPHLPSRNHPTPRPAFTLIELIACICAAAIIVGVILPPMGRRRCGCGCRQLKDSTQIRAIVQSMVVWSQNHNGNYPLPSRLDTTDQTVTAQGRAKDTTGNILSILIFEGNITPELCISRQESNTTQVQKMDDYEYTNPSAAVNPAQALWDPRFRGTPIDAPVGTLSAAAPSNQSYAHTIPVGAKLAQWRDNFAPNQPVFGNRGPQYAPNDFAPHPQGRRWKLLEGPTGTGSNTLLIHGGRTTWEGNIGHNDGSVRFEISPSPDTITYQRITSGKPASTPDNLFVNESDEVGGDAYPGVFGNGLNAFLRPVAASQPDRVTTWVD